MVSERELDEYITIYLELAVKYGIDVPVPTKEECIEAILKHREDFEQAQEYARQLGKSFASHCDSTILPLMRDDKKR